MRSLQPRNTCKPGRTFRWGNARVELTERRVRVVLDGKRRLFDLAEFTCIDVDVNDCGVCSKAFRTPGGAIVETRSDGDDEVAGQGDLETAAQQLKTSEELGEHAGFPQNPYRWRVAAARLREAQGDFDGALKLLEEAERRYVSDFYPNVRPIPAVRARVWIRQERLGNAIAWACRSAKR